MEAALGVHPAATSRRCRRCKPPAWARNEIDRFVLAALEAKGLAPSPEADRETLIRRVTLRPDRPAADRRRGRRVPRRHARPTPTRSVVDRLLASPRYGERMAADWLDVARYADTHGYQDDGMRDDVAVARLGDRGLQRQPAVRPVHHLAARRRPAARTPTHEQRLATGFNRNHMQSQEGGIVAEEYRIEYVVDRVEHARPRLPRPDASTAPLPRPQVRPDHAEGVLPALRLLQQRRRDRADSVLGRAEPDGDGQGRRRRAEARGAPRAHRAGSRPRPPPTSAASTGVRSVAGPRHRRLARRAGHAARAHRHLPLDAEQRGFEPRSPTRSRARSPNACRL